MDGDGSSGFELNQCFFCTKEYKFQIIFTISSP